MLLSLVIISACGGTPLTGTSTTTGLRICRAEDPIPDAVDDERSLCLSVSLAALETGSFTVDATASLADASDATTLVFSPRAANSARLTSAWAGGSCFSIAGHDPATQQLTGTIRVDTVSASSVVGSVDVTISGALAGMSCGFSMPATLKGSFHLAR